MNNVTITMPEDVARSVLQAVTDDPDRSRWGHHQHNRTIAQQALARALSAPATEDDEDAAADAADVRRQTAEDIATAIEADAEKRRPQTFWRKVRAGAAGPSDPNRWFWEGHIHAARLAREVGGDRG